ncbi:hypothetical protein SIN8267_01891 [Sinobacterium norvegicum]|uniref:Lipoprotein n=1 Tax=Sinobacterium norvegicum TaxID=1641715 RepID=A0ABN8ELL8_9GAMM|nr:DUF3313 family protein [Sinobacterium norvegicum]CAH0991777.1 hypothetical protein SIN8267_01891 [Sinobacterium norvegicum]
MRTLTRFTTGCAIALTTACTTPQPEISHDGLSLKNSDEFTTVYVKPNAEFSQYQHVSVDGCQVAFKKNWQRDQNSSRVALTNRVTDKDVEKIKTQLSELCVQEFSRVLQSVPAESKQENLSTTLVIKPSIINLDVVAPDIMSPNMSRTYTTSSGEMTLSLEIFDASSGEIMARIIDRRRQLETMNYQWSNSVTNRSDAARTLKSWANSLDESLTQVMSKQ